MTAPGEADCRALDAADTPALAALATLRAQFAPGAEGTLYFDANSIGPMPLAAPAAVQQVLEQGWRIARRRSWNESDWLQQPQALGDALAPLLGAEAGDLVVGDSTSVNQYKLLRHALALAAPRRVLVVERDVFPSNRYVAEGIAHAGLAELRLIATPEDLEAALAPGDVAVVALSHVDYRSSRRLPMAHTTALAQRHGALVLWDLSHSAGAVRVELRASNADFALGCGYKYLAGGPGAPALVYLHPRHHAAAWPAICGWMGHADTFAFDPRFAPAAGPAALLPGTPAVLANAAFGAVAALWRQADPVALDARHRSLTDTLIALLDARCAGFGLELASPREHAQRGGHVALRFEGAQALAQALVEAGVVVSARKPDALRFGVHPITTLHHDLWVAVQRLHELLASERWREPRFQGAAV